ncbi:MAG: glycosyltransferase family 4 protein [Gammaproteobacteria bacterium]|jgi:glycosyltransferase involved in cell wall biosynthesis|nr:glycosyltransferase family 4 protein [Gammaproteobacteria bacterium]
MRAEICHINLSRGYRGGGRQTEILIRALAERGWPQSAVVREGGELASRLRSIRGLTVVEKPGNLLTAALFGGAAAILHVHQGRSTYVAGLQHLLRRRPYVITRRVDNPIRRTLANRFLYRHASHIVALSAAVAQAVRALEPSLQCTLIPDAVADLPHDPAAAHRIKAGTGKACLVGHIGALDDSHKGQLQLIAAARALQSRAPDIGFMLVGSGRDERMLREAAAGLENLQFAGQVNNVGDYLAAFDVFAFPSRREGLGSSLLDAYQFALPVVATRAGGIPDIVTAGVNGTLVEVDDIESLTAALLHYCHDAEARAAIGAANRRAAEQYAGSAIAARYETLYQQITAGGAR